MYLIRLNQKNDLWKRQQGESDQRRPNWIDGSTISLDAFVSSISLDSGVCLNSGAAMGGSAGEHCLAAIS